MINIFKAHLKKEGRNLKMRMKKIMTLVMAIVMIASVLPVMAYTAPDAIDLVLEDYEVYDVSEIYDVSELIAPEQSFEAFDALVAMALESVMPASDFPAFGWLGVSDSTPLASGMNHAMMFVYSYDDTMSPAPNFNNVEVRVTIPAGVNVLPSAPAGFAVATAPGAGGTTIVTITITNPSLLTVGGADGPQLMLSVPNGITDDGQQFTVSYEFRYNNAVIGSNSGSQTMTSSANSFTWGISRAGAPTTVTTITAPATAFGADMTFTYTPSNSIPTLFGGVFVETLVVTNRISVGDNFRWLFQDFNSNRPTITGTNVNVAASTVVPLLADGVTVATTAGQEVAFIDVTIVYNNNNASVTGVNHPALVSTVTIPANSLHVRNTGIGFSSQPALTSTNNTVLTYGSSIRTASWWNATENRSVRTATLTTTLARNATFVPEAGELPGPSERVQIRVVSITGNGETNPFPPGRPFFNPLDTIVYEIYNFGNFHTTPYLTNFGITHTVPAGMDPTSITTGVYTGKTGTYTITVHFTNGTTQTFTPNYATSTTHTINIPAGYRVETIVWDFGTVNPGFAPTTPPRVTARGWTMTQIEAFNATAPEANRIVDGTHIPNNVRVDFRVRTTGAMGAATHAVSRRFAEDVIPDGEKFMRNLTTGEEGINTPYVAGDLVEFTIRYTNNTGLPKHNFFIIDTFCLDALEPYIMVGPGVTLQPGFTGNNIRMEFYNDAYRGSSHFWPTLAGTQHVRVTDGVVHQMANMGDAHGAFTINRGQRILVFDTGSSSRGVRSMIAPGATVIITYVMRVRDDHFPFTDTAEFSNEFEIQGYRAGGGGYDMSLHVIGGGYIRGTTRPLGTIVGLRQMVESRNDANTAWVLHRQASPFNPVRFGQTARITLYVTNSHTSQRTMNIRNVTPQLQWNVINSFDFPATAQVAVIRSGTPLSAATWVDAAFDQNAGWGANFNPARIRVGQSSLASDGSLAIPPGFQAVIRYEVTMNRWPEVAGPLVDAFQNINHSVFFEEAAGTDAVAGYRFIRFGTLLPQTPTTTTTTNNPDMDHPYSVSFIRTASTDTAIGTWRIYPERQEGRLAGAGITGTAIAGGMNATATGITWTAGTQLHTGPILDPRAETFGSRLMEARITNYNRTVGEDIEINSITVRLPRYESFGSWNTTLTGGGVSLTTTTATFAAIPETNFTVTHPTVTIGGVTYNQVVVTFNSPLILPARTGGDNHLRLRFNTIMTPAAFASAMNEDFTNLTTSATPAAQPQWGFLTDAQVSFVSPTQLISVGIPATPNTHGGPITSAGNNVWNGAVQPGRTFKRTINPSITVAPYFISGTNYVPITGDTPVGLNTPVAWRITVGTAGAPTANNLVYPNLVDPVVVVTFPAGMSLRSTNPIDIPDEDIKGYSIVGRTVTIALDRTINQGTLNQYSFHIITDRVYNSGQHVPHLVLAPNAEHINMSSVEMGQIWGGGVTQRNINFAEITGMLGSHMNDVGFDFTRNRDIILNNETIFIGPDWRVPITMGLQTNANQGQSSQTIDTTPDGSTSIHLLSREGNELTFALNFTNNNVSALDFDNFAIVNRLPLAGDLHNTNSNVRGSNFDVRLLATPMISVTTLLEELNTNPNWIIQYTTAAANTVFNDADFGGAGTPAAIWSSDFTNEATAFRVVFDDSFPLRHTVQIVYSVEFSDISAIPATNAILRNTFGYSFTASTNDGSINIRSEMNPLTITVADDVSDTFTVTYNATLGSNPPAADTGIIPGTNHPLRARDNIGEMFSHNQGEHPVVFIGWTTNEAVATARIYTGSIADRAALEGQLITQITNIQADTTVFAVWGVGWPWESEDKWTVTYNATLGTNAPAAQTDIINGNNHPLHHRNSNAVALMTHPNQGEHPVLFVGWTTNETFANAQIYTGSTADRTAVEAQLITQITNIRADATVFAIWGVDTTGNGIPDVLDGIMITFDASSGENPPPPWPWNEFNPVLPTPGNMTHAPQDSYQVLFIGWTLNPEFANARVYIGSEADRIAVMAHIITQLTNIQEDTTLYAIWGIDTTGSGIPDVWDDVLIIESVEILIPDDVGDGLAGFTILRGEWAEETTATVSFLVRLNNSVDEDIFLSSLERMSFTAASSQRFERRELTATPDLILTTDSLEITAASIGDVVEVDGIQYREVSLEIINTLKSGIVDFTLSFTTANNSEILASAIHRVLIPGDVNRDGQVNSLDHVYIFAMMRSLLEMPARMSAGFYMFELADVNGDGQVNSLDHSAVFNMMRGLVPTN